MTAATDPTAPRVLFVDNAPAVGGVQVTLRNILPMLGAAGWRVAVAIPRGSAVGREWYRPAGIDVREIDLPSQQGRAAPLALARGALAVARAARAFRADVVHANSTRAGLAAVAARPLAGVPVVWTMHEGYVPRPSRVASALADIVLYRSEAQRGMYRWARTSNMRRVYPGTPDRFLHPEAREQMRRGFRRELGFPEDCPLLGQVGSLTWWKGFDVFIRAARRIAARQPDARFVIVGGEGREPDEPARLRRLAADLGLGETLCFAGFRANAPELIGALDLLVHAPVFPESFGIVVADAMMQGVPPVVAALGSMTELVADGVDGAWFPPQDDAALARVALDLLADPARRAPGRRRPPEVPAPLHDRGGSAPLPGRLPDADPPTSAGRIAEPPRVSTLSVVVITLNEERDLPACLASVAFADEIVVVDSGSVDLTREIARAAGARVLEHPWRGFAEQWNVAIDAATRDWVLVLAADERVTPRLRASIEAVLRDPAPTHDGYAMPRRNDFLGRWLRHSGWYPSYELRLVRRGRGRMDARRVHERLVVTGSTGRLAGDLLHYGVNSLWDYVETLNRYTSLEAEEAVARDVRFAWLPPPGPLLAFLRAALAGPLRRDRLYFLAKDPFKNRFVLVWAVPLLPLARFLRMYALQRGYRDGARGLIVAALSAFYDVVRYCKIWEAREKGEGG